MLKFESNIPEGRSATSFSAASALLRVHRNGSQGYPAAAALPPPLALARVSQSSAEDIASELS